MNGHIGDVTLCSKYGEVIFMPKDWRATDNHEWRSLQKVAPESYRCGYCGNDVASEVGLENNTHNAFIRVCPQCNVPTFFSATGLQIPGPKPGGTLYKLPELIGALYEEARSSRSANAFTGTVMLCRKLLMHIATQKGAEKDKGFAYYVDWLIKERYAPRGAEEWVTYIKDRSNEANHEIVQMNKEDADGLLNLTEQLLRNVYELPGLVPPKEPASQSETGSNGS